jgi:hypothetical protein
VKGSRGIFWMCRSLGENGGDRGEGQVEVKVKVELELELES